MAKSHEPKVLIKLDSGSEPYRELFRRTSESVSRILDCPVLLRGKVEEGTLLAQMSVASFDFAHEAEPFVLMNRKSGEDDICIEMQTKTIPHVNFLACSFPFTRSHKLVQEINGTVKTDMKESGCKIVDFGIYLDIVTFYSAKGERIKYVGLKELGF